MNTSTFLCTLALAGALALPAQSAALQPRQPQGHVLTLKPGASPQFHVIDKLTPSLNNAGDMKLNESFEDKDKFPPPGWSIDLENPNDWMVYSPLLSSITPTDGYYSAMGTCLKNQLHDASWLISPQIDVVENDELMFDLYFDVRALYVWTTEGADKTVDEADGSILQRINAENLKVCVREPGGQWRELLNLWDEYGKLGYWTILDEYSKPEYRPFRVSLADFVGKKVEIGFCHSYTNEKGGYGMFLDAVKVGLPPIATAYAIPANTLFFGLSNDWDGFYDSAIVPPYVEREFISLIAEEVDKVEWKYTRLADDESFTATDAEGCTIEYTPCYAENPETKLTAYSFPTLSATNAAGSSGTFTYGGEYGRVYVGAEAVLDTKDGGQIQCGMSTFNLSDDLMIYNADFSVPAYGYSSMTKEWWTNHYFDGDQGDGDAVEVVSNMNFFFDQGTPIVVDAIRVAASVECQSDAEFKLEVIGVNEDFTLGDVLATAVCKGSDLIKVDASFSPFPNTALLPFKFEKPLVVEGMNFVARLSGFNNDKVTYYATLQSYESTDLCYAFVDLAVTAPSMGQPDTRNTMMGAYNLDDYGTSSFAFFLDARMPWLRTEETEFSATGEDSNRKKFAFDSSYAGSELAFSGENGDAIPDWLKVEGAGSYGNTTVTVTVLQGGKTAESFNLLVSAPGVSKTLRINRGVWTGGIQDIIGDATVVGRQWIDLQGRVLNSEPVKDVFMECVTHADGTSTVKKVVK